MKKFLGICLAVLLVAQMTACSTMFPFSMLTKGQSESSSSDTLGSGESVVSPDSSAPESATSSETKQPNTEEIVLIDNKDCAVVLTGIEPDAMMGYTLKVRLENKSKDVTYMFAVQDATINGLQSDPFFAAEVAAGKKSNEEIWFDSEELAEVGLTDITDIELFFDVYDTDDWEAESVATETVHVYPNGKDKATVYKREAKSSDVVLVDNQYVTVTAIDGEYDDIWGYSLNLFLENKTDTTVMFTVDDVAVNGFMVDPFYATTVPAGRCGYSAVTWSLESLEKNGIEVDGIETIDMTVVAYDDEDYSADDFVNEPVSLEIE